VLQSRWVPVGLSSAFKLWSSVPLSTVSESVRRGAFRNNESGPTLCGLGGRPRSLADHAVIELTVH
jgi:hypothetical protein